MRKPQTPARRWRWQTHRPRALAQYVVTLAKTGNTPPSQRVVIRQLGSASGGVVDGGISKSIALLTFLVTFFLWCVLVLVGGRFVESWRATAMSTTDEATECRAQGQER